MTKILKKNHVAISLTLRLLENFVIILMMKMIEKLSEFENFIVVQFPTGGIKSISAFLEEVTKICIQVQFLMLNNMERATRPKNGMAF